MYPPHQPRRFPRSSGQRRRRPAYSLVEMLVVFAVVSVVFTAVGTTLHTLAGVNRQLRANLPQLATLTRLSLRLREDAHGAEQWSIERRSESHAVVELRQGDGSAAVYETAEERVVRRRLRGDQQLGQEIYRFPGATTFRWEVTGDRESLLTLGVEQPAGRIAGAGDAVRVNELTTALGLNAKAR